MIESILNKIAISENGEYRKKEVIVSLPDGSRCPEISHKLNFYYKNCNIDIQIKTGLSNSARIKTKLSEKIIPIKFEISSINHFTNIFLRKNNRFKVKCKDKDFKKFLEKEALFIFNNIMKSQNFDPTIFTNKKNVDNQIITEFSIIFKNWANVFIELTIFLKTVIDKLSLDSQLD